MSRHGFRRPDISDKPLCPYTIEMCARAMEDEAGRTWLTAMKISRRAQDAVEDGDQKKAEMLDAASITLQEINHQYYRCAETIRNLLVEGHD